MQLNKNSGLNVYIYFYFLPPPSNIYIYMRKTILYNLKPHGQKSGREKGTINFWKLETTSLVDPQELTPKPARKKAENKT